MLNDYVEHAGSPAAGLVPTVPQLQYQGFEPSPYDTNDNRAFVDNFLNPLESAADVATEPLFELARVQVAIEAPLISMAVSSDVLFMGLANNVITMIELARPETIIRLPINRKPTEMTLYKMFLDPSGRHLIITSTQGENWYLYRGWKRLKQLKSFKMVIESIAWNKPSLLSSSHSTSSREFLIGARNGTVYEALLDAEDDFFKSQDRYLQPVFSLPERQPVTGIKFTFYPPSDPQRAVIILTTVSRIYQFVGNLDRKTDDGSRVFLPIFAKYRDTAPKISELPGNLSESELHLWMPSADQALSLPKIVAWMTGSGIYHGMMNYMSTSDDFIDATALLQYPTFDVPSQSAPTSMALTEFHYVLLYKDRVVAICNLDDRTVYEEGLPIKPGEVVRGIVSDPVRSTYWVYTDSSLFELLPKNEDRDIWKIYLEKGQFDVALRYAKKAGQRDRVLIAQADAFFNEGRYIPSAQAYAQCSASFEEVALKFIDMDQRDALRYYLISRLERTRKTDVTQRMMLATWLLEIYLSKCNELEDVIASESVSHDVDNLQAERTVLEEELRQFLETYKSNLDTKTVYELIQSHGRTEVYLHFATVIGDFERVVEHWILEEEWLKAIDVLNRQTNLELYYRFGPVLMCQAPKETVDSWLRQEKINATRLVPALLSIQHVAPDPLMANQAVRYLNHVIFDQQNTSSTIHNLLITFYVTAPRSGSDDDTALLRYLTTAPTDPITGKPYYDLDYALRLCIQAGRTQPCVHIYSKMGLWENSVELALAKGDLELAKLNADMPVEDEPLRKKLWLKIAKYVVQDKKDIKTAMAFLESTVLLKIEDILPFFPDFVVIDDFKEEICAALEGYSAHIDSLKAEMDEATRSAEFIKQDIKALRNRFVTIDAGERCSYCGYSLFTRQFYVFPCQHTFHADCLISLAKEYLPAHALRRILALQTEFLATTQATVDRANITGPNPPIPQEPLRHTRQRTLLSAGFTAPLQNGTRAAGSLGRNILSAGDKLRDLIVPESLASVVSAGVWSTGLDRVGMGIIRAGAAAGIGEKDKSKQMDKAREELDELLASVCPLCENVVVGLDRPFVKAGEEDLSWQI
ncbi:DigA protein [Rickenella mellea]|uniref:DigA protein n=1 Tax=Rickenella mellea TaxID=50990 RepID=A0A4Y7QNV8_9AGAM|nr:DigA protein [Rickenella mellea]